MEQENKTTVTINLSEYMALVECAVDLENIRKALYLGASLSYKNSLRFDDDMINTLLSIIDSGRYEQKLAELKEVETEA